MPIIWRNEGFFLLSCKLCYTFYDMRKFIFLYLSIILLILLALSFFWIYEAKIYIGRAEEVGEFSPINSYVFITPTRAEANCIEGQPENVIRTYIYAIDDNGIGISGLTVKLSVVSNLEYTTIQGITDSYGKGVIDVGSCTEGTYFVDVIIDNQLLPSQQQFVFD